VGKCDKVLLQFNYHMLLFKTSTRNSEQPERMTNRTSFPSQRKKKKLSFSETSILALWTTRPSI